MLKVFWKENIMPHIIKKICIDCGKEFWGDARPHNKRCSNKCRWKSKYYRKLMSEIARKKVGEKSPRWKGGRKKYECAYCGKEFFAHLSSKRKLCSNSCRAKWVGKQKIGKHRSPKTREKIGKSNSRPRLGGRIKASGGYMKIWIGRKKYIQEHRLVMENFLGRKPSRKSFFDIIHKRSEI
jgi:hypothetical protein